MDKAVFTKLNSANVSVDNSADTERVYDIKCNANLNNNLLNSIESGSVMKDGIQVATFSKWSNIFTPSFQNVTDDDDEMCNILKAITTFIKDVKNKIETNPIEV